MQKSASSNVISINRRQERNRQVTKGDFYIVFTVILTILAVLITAFTR